jgi:stress-induced morphogen
MVHAQALVESTNLTGKLDVRRHRRLLRALGRAHYAIEALPR